MMNDNWFRNPYFPSKSTNPTLGDCQQCHRKFAEYVDIKESDQTKFYTDLLCWRNWKPISGKIDCDRIAALDGDK